MTDSMTHGVIGDFVQILGSTFWALGGQNQKSKKTFCSFCHGEVMAKKWLDSIKKQKRRINVCDKQTDGQTDGQTDRVNDKK